MPRPKRPMIATVMIVFSVLLIGGYGAMAFTQREPGEPDREEVPKSVRASPGGYRSYHFWHSGYHGGK
ncbi:MAG: hypothetical protein ABI591_25450 [Kofleriaceae bacterium]